jgi:NADH:ubiquinone oxidoreductase subunit 4 (subunit M)
MMISHAMLSANFFLVVDSLTRRFKTRLITEISGIFYLAPSLYFLTLSLLIVFLGFPGSLLFVSEFLFFTALLDLNIFIFFFLFFFAYFVVPSCFFKSWFLILFGFNLNKTTAYKSLDLNSIELLLNWSLIVLLF